MNDCGSGIAFETSHVPNEPCSAVDFHVRRAQVALIILHRPRISVRDHIRAEAACREAQAAPRGCLRAHRELRVRHELPDRERERQRRVLNRAAARQRCLRESPLPGRIRVAHVDHGQLDFARRFRVAERLAFIDAHLGFAREARSAAGR